MILNPLLNAELSENVQPMFCEMLFSPGGIFFNFEITASIQYSGPNGKCFTYVTKTCANLTTYSRKPENYNGTIIIEIAIMKNSLWTVP